MGTTSESVRSLPSHTFMSGLRAGAEWSGHTGAFLAVSSHCGRIPPQNPLHPPSTGWKGLELWVHGQGQKAENLGPFPQRTLQVFWCHFLKHSPHKEWGLKFPPQGLTLS